ncbi:MAG: uroporphyrinogen-III synthase [Betaproteobacteria bacterium]|nr:uroporphyrinogen-III synthase [Betaproteobacteria bacterium]
MKPLAGLGVLVTRPAHQAGHLAGLIEQAGGKAIRFPTLEIFDAKDMSVLSAAIDRLEQFDLAIFISPNAVNKAVSLIRARRDWPQGLRCAAVGKGSGKALALHGIADVLVPQDRFDSEALLALPELQDVGGKQVVIFRGEGGRELLGEELTRRGAGVTFAECYRRGKPDGTDVESLLQQWARGDVGAVTVTSGESMRNLFDLVGATGQQFLKKTPVFAFHEEIAEVARELGIEQVYTTPSGDDGLLSGLIAWRKTR